jgi:hypothetical protein
MKRKLALWLALISLSILALPYAVFALHAVPLENMAVAIGADASVGRTFQRDTFYANGRAWAFYMGYDPFIATHMYFKTSTDGVNWQPRSFFCDVTDADEFSLFWDGTFVHTVWVANDALQSGVNYRRGTPNSDGTITWTATQEVYAPSLTDAYVLPTITAYTGIPYIAYGHSVLGTQLWGATASNQTDGTWAQDVVFENTDLVAGNSTVAACIDAIPAIGIIHVTIESVVPPEIFPQVGSIRYTAGAWQPYETIIDSAAFGDNLCSTVPWGTVMNVITNFVPGNNISHRQSAPGGAWVIAPVAQVISLNSYIQATAGVWDVATGDLKCFFSSGLPNNISWKHYDNALGTWDVGFFGLDDPATVDRMNCAQIHASPMGVVYENNLAPDSDIVYYDYLDSFPPSGGSSSNVLAIIVVTILAIIIAFIILFLRGSANLMYDGSMTFEDKATTTVVVAMIIGIGLLVITAIFAMFP